MIITPDRNHTQKLPPFQRHSNPQHLVSQLSQQGNAPSCGKESEREGGTEFPSEFRSSKIHTGNLSVQGRPDTYNNGNYDIKGLLQVRITRS